jgi:hypothetical protein
MVDGTLAPGSKSDGIISFQLRPGARGELHTCEQSDESSAFTRPKPQSHASKIKDGLSKAVSSLFGSVARQSFESKQAGYKEACDDSESEQTKQPSVHNTTPCASCDEIRLWLTDTLSGSAYGTTLLFSCSFSQSIRCADAFSCSACTATPIFSSSLSEPIWFTNPFSSSPCTASSILSCPLPESASIFSCSLSESASVFPCPFPESQASCRAVSSSSPSTTTSYRIQPVNEPRTFPCARHERQISRRLKRSIPSGINAWTTRPHSIPFTGCNGRCDVFFARYGGTTKRTIPLSATTFAAPQPLVARSIRRTPDQIKDQSVREATITSRYQCWVRRGSTLTTPRR